MLTMNLLPNDFIHPFDSNADINTKKQNKNSSKNDFQAPDFFDKKLAQNIHNIDNLVTYTRQHIPHPEDKRALLEEVTNIVRSRFIHAYSIYGMRENWIAVLAGKFIWRDLSAKVIPDDILKDDVASCSQISIVIMAACSRLGITTRKVGLVGHYTLEANINNKWFFVDADLKPDFNSVGGRKSLDEILTNRDQFPLYANTILDSNEIEKKFSTIQYGEPNVQPAPKAYLFQMITKKISHWGWLLPTILSIITLRRKEQYINSLNSSNANWALQYNK
jgi:hypothetical protein